MLPLSNVLAQGFKVVIRDIALHMSNRAMDYSSEDFGLCRGALETRRAQHVHLNEADLASVQEYLETSNFVQARFSVPIVESNEL